MQLKPHQERARDFIRSHRRCLNGSDIGTGKTAEAIAAYKDTGAIIICPAFLRRNWVRELKMWGEDARLIQLLENTSSPASSTAKWIVMSFEGYVARHEKRYMPTMPLIVDEAHGCKSLSTKRTKAILGKEGLARNCNQVCLMTGTPFPNNLVDCYPLFAFCTNGRLGRFKDFCDTFSYSRRVSYGQRGSGVKYYGAKNLAQLVEVVKNVLYRDRIEDVITELPDFEDFKVELDIDRAAEKIIDSLNLRRDEVAAALSSGGNIKQDGELSTLRRLLGIQKVPQAVDFISDLLDQGQSVVSFAHHKDVVTGVYSALQEKHYQVAFITGDTPHAVREAHIRGFQAGSIKCLVCSILAMGLGVTLTAANIAVFVEEAWTPAAMEQARGRIRRLGQDRPCLYYYLLYPNSIDETVHYAVKSKAKVSENFWKEFKGEKAEKEERIIWD